MNKTACDASCFKRRVGFLDFQLPAVALLVSISNSTQFTVKENVVDAVLFAASSPVPVTVRV
jgi:hypothetical protein